MLSIIQAPNEILRTPAQPVKLPVARLQKIIADMTATLVAQNDPEGVGLAANQVGLPYRLFVARFDIKNPPAGGSPVRAFINPEIVAHSEDLQPAPKEKAPLEGCLSLPKYYGVVKRYQWVVVRFQFLGSSGKYEEKEEKFTGFAATVIQHEMDHLSGRIFVEQILEQSGKLYKSTGKNKRGKDIWEKVEI